MDTLQESRLGIEPVTGTSKGSFKCKATYSDGTEVESSSATVSPLGKFISINQPIITDTLFHTLKILLDIT